MTTSNPLQPHVLSLTEKGITVTPALSHHIKAKAGGAHIMLRLRKDRKVLLYLRTDLYAPEGTFNETTKQVAVEAINSQLLRLFDRAVAMVKASTPATDFRARWAEERKSEKQVEFDAKWGRLRDHFAVEDKKERYTLLVEERRYLEGELRNMDATIEALRIELKLPLVADPIVGRVEYQVFKDAMIAFLAEHKAVRTKRDYQMWFSWSKVLDKYAQATGKELSLMSFNLDFYTDYKRYIMVTRGNVLNTFGAHVKKLKAFLKFSERLGLVVHHESKDKRFKIREEEKAVVYLDDEELDLLWDYRLVRPDAVNYINLTLFQALTGLRISDVAKHHGFTKVKKDGVVREYLSGTCQKNGGKYKVPVALDERIKEILIHHCFDMNILTEAEYNEEIKSLVADLYAHHGLEMPKVCIEREDVNGTLQHTYPEKNTVLTTHSNRRSFISRHINSTEFNQYDILSMIGSKDLSELEKYIDIDDGSLHKKAEANSTSRRQQAANRKAKRLTE